MVIKEIIDRLEALSPPMFAEKWDNSGLLCGHYDSEVNKILVCVDVTDSVVDQAIKQEVDLVISHHPLIFKGLKKLSDQDFIGRRVVRLVENRIGLYAMHTNFDVMGMADEAADILDLTNPSVLMATFEDQISKEGIGRIGMLPRRMTLKECAMHVKEVFHITEVKVYGPLNTKLDIAAICPGSGADSIEDALYKGAQVLITGDISHHQGIDSVARGLCIIDAGHYNLEKIFMDYMKDYLNNEFKGIKVVKAKDEPPFIVV